MNKDAIKQAWERYHKAKLAHKRLAESNNLADAASAWSDFLTYASTVFVKLERGAKDDKKSGPWMGRIKNERKLDPLLSYIHAARNCDEHGIAPVTDRQGPEVRIGSGGGAMWIKNARMEDGVFTMDAVALSPGGFLRTEFLPEQLVLIEVTDDRFKDTFQPPRMHMGKPITDQSLVGVSSLALAYMDAMLRAAAVFAH